MKTKPSLMIIEILNTGSLDFSFSFLCIKWICLSFGYKKSQKACDPQKNRQGCTNELASRHQQILATVTKQQRRMMGYV